MLRYIKNFRAKIYVYRRTKIRKFKKFFSNFFFALNPIIVNAELKANSNMALKARIVKKERRKLSLLYHLFFFFCFFSILMFYDVADEELYLFIYEFHKWW
jgi:hypothetical protein